MRFRKTILRTFLLFLLSVILIGCSEGNTKSLNESNNNQRKETEIDKKAKDFQVKEIDNSDSLLKDLEKIREEERSREYKPSPSNDDSYINSDGEEVQSPTWSPSKPAGATARCRDGTYSFSHSRRGTCSHHGGVATWY